MISWLAKLAGRLILLPLVLTVKRPKVMIPVLIAFMILVVNYDLK